MRLLFTLALVALALGLLFVSPLLALGVGFLAYRCGTNPRAEEELVAALMVAGGIGVAYTVAKGIWPNLP